MSIILPSQPRWRPITRPGPSGFIEVMSDELRRFELAMPEQMPDLRGAQALAIASDYGGQHQNAMYKVYTFVVADLSHWNARGIDRDAVRRHYLSDGRGLGFKNMRGAGRLKALAPFLATLNSIPGAVVTVAVDRELAEVVSDAPRGQLRDVVGTPVPPEAVFEDMIRVAMILTVLIGGLGSPGQRVVWITDNDPLLDTRVREQQVGRLLKLMGDHYVDHPPGRIQAASTRAGATYSDLLTPPDLVAGALGELLGRYRHIGVSLTTALQVPPPAGISPKSKVILSWLATYRYPFKRWVFVVSPAGQPRKVAVSLVRLHGTADLSR